MTEADWANWLRVELKSMGVVINGLPMLATRLAAKVDEEIVASYAVCAVSHDMLGPCELTYRHDGPHERTPGGATEPNRWYGTTCQCCVHVYGPAVDL